MQWPEIHDTFLAAAESVTDLVGRVDDFSVPALGSWTARDLTGHLYRAIVTPVWYLAEPEPTAGPLPGAAAYVAAYLDWRDENPATVDTGIARRATDELEGIEPTAFPRLFREAVASVRAALQRVSWDRKIPSRLGPIRIQDYLRTRTLEATIHGLDLARATGVAWSPPDGAVTDSLVLLTEVARLRGTAEELLMALTGRSYDPAALPVMQ